MARVCLLLLASASVALGSPLCCIVGSGQSPPRHERTCECPGCQKGAKQEAPTPAPKPCPEKQCPWKSDVSTHAAGTGHVEFVAVADAPSPRLPAPAAAPAGAVAHRALPPSPARISHPLLL